MSSLQRGNLHIRPTYNSSDSIRSSDTEERGSEQELHEIEDDGQQAYFGRYAGSFHIKKKPSRAPHEPIVLERYCLLISSPHFVCILDTCLVFLARRVKMT